jgi:hypothetical protein
MLRVGRNGHSATDSGSRSDKNDPLQQKSSRPRILADVVAFKGLSSILFAAFISLALLNVKNDKG